jgi:adenylate cyclase
MSGGPTQKETSQVLVVDDDAVSRIMLRRSLELYGYQVIEADDGEQCLASVAHQRPDLIVLDGVMPRMDGFTVVSRLRAEDSTRTVPILMLTSLQDVSYKVRGFELGADDFLNKPVDRVELVARVRSLLRMKHYHDELEQKNILLRQALSRYVVEEVANEILARKNQNLYLNGQSGCVTVLYADVRGFHEFMQSHDAQAVIKLLNTVYDKLVPIIFEHRGTFDKYIDDAVMAFFGAPVPYPDDPLRAVQTAIKMRDTFQFLKNEQPAFSMLNLGVGIYTGEAVVGYIGSEQAMDYTVMGTPASAAKSMIDFVPDSQILISSQTYQAVRDLVDAKPVSPLTLRRRGEQLAIDAYEVLALRPNGQNTQSS